MNFFPSIFPICLLVGITWGYSDESPPFPPKSLPHSFADSNGNCLFPDSLQDATLRIFERHLKKGASFPTNHVVSEAAKEANLSNCNARRLLISFLDSLEQHRLDETWSKFKSFINNALRDWQFSGFGQIAAIKIDRTGKVLV